MSDNHLAPPAPDPHKLYADHDTNEPPSSAQMLAARQVALELLDRVLSRKTALDHALSHSETFKALPSRDRAFCRMLVATTLRRLGQIDDLINKAQERKSPHSLVLVNILRMGVAQIAFMDVPDHAAVDTSVRLADAAKMDRQKGFVNAILRTITRSIGQEWLTRQDEGRLNTPEWLLKIWIADYGLRTAAEIAKANLVEAPLDITIKDEGERNYWAGTLKASEIGAGSLRRPAGGAIQALPGFDDGQWWVQDASAALPASLFGDIKGKTVIDLCAAPGGKTLQLASKGAQVIAVDRSAKRLKRLEQNLERLNMKERVEVQTADASVWTPAEAPSYILLDAPCSATGTIRRHPDVFHLKAPKDVESLINVQATILENAFNMLEPEGILIYCTCSLQKSEGEDQIQRLFENHEDAVKLPIRAEEIGGLEDCITELGDLRILPFHQAPLGGMDGFFVSRITKSRA